MAECDISAETLDREKCGLRYAKGAVSIEEEDKMVEEVQLGDVFEERDSATSMCNQLGPRDFRSVRMPEPVVILEKHFIMNMLSE